MAGLALIGLVLLDGFEAMVFPRRVKRTLRPTRLFYRTTWRLWRAAAGLVPGRKRQATFLSVFGPLSMLALFVVWVAGLICGFALLTWSLGVPLKTGGQVFGIPTYLYMSGVTFFPLGYGEVTPGSGLGRALAVVEAGTGFGFMAVIIGYLPVLYGAFSRREAPISLLDARAGSPPSVGQLLVRLGEARNLEAVQSFLVEWERWAAELLESHLSFPVLSYYRSQHDNQSWLGALTMILDTCAVLMAGLKGANRYQARLTFAAARHATVDLAMVFDTPPCVCEERLPPERLQQFRGQLAAAGLAFPEDAAADARLDELRRMYEPFVAGLSRHFLMPLPAFVPDAPAVDNWQTSAWMRRLPGFGELPLPAGDEHFD
jgi:hypothetical protein